MDFSSVNYVATSLVQVLLTTFYVSAGGKFIVLIFLVLAGFMAFKTRKRFKTKNREEDEEDIEDIADLEEAEKIVKKCAAHLTDSLAQTETLFSLGISSFLNEDLNTLKSCMDLKADLSKSLDKFKNKVFRIAPVFENSLHSGHYYIELKDYQIRMVNSVSLLLEPLYEHLNNTHKPFTNPQKQELYQLEKEVAAIYTISTEIINTNCFSEMENLAKMHQTVNELLEKMEVAQIKRIKTKQVNTRNSILFLNTLSETKNMLIHAIHLIKAHRDFITVTNKQIK